MKQRAAFLTSGVLMALAPAAWAQTTAPAEDTGQREEPEENTSEKLRLHQLAVSNGLKGTTGLMHLVSADSGPEGSFRASMSAYFYSGHGFLCPNCTEDPQGDVSIGEDDIGLYGTRIQLSGTPLPFLEAFGAMRFQSVSNDKGTPETMQIVGDTTLGVKGFMPTREDRFYTIGGGLAVDILTRSGSVGAGAVSPGLLLASTFDLERRKEDLPKIPLRIHANAGYYFDQSGKLAKEAENDRASVLGSRQRITRIERFGQDINRVDSMRLGAGIEGTFDYVQPFAEWTIDIPVNRQGYECRLASRSAGDECLDVAGFNAVPSRLSLGARIIPWVNDWTEGLSLLAAMDVGTGGTRHFIEEVAPEIPWTAYLGLGYAFDTVRKVRVETKTVEKVIRLKPPDRRIRGVVVDAETGLPLADAAVHIADSMKMGILTDPHGQFQTDNLKPGTYDFKVTLEGYEPGTCQGTVPDEPEEPEEASVEGEESAEGAPSEEPPGAASDEPPGPASDEPPGAASDGEKLEGGKKAKKGSEEIRCELKKLPAVANVSGVVRDAVTTQYVQNAAVTIQDPKDRELTLTTDDFGAFRFENVPAGESRLTISADGYLDGAIEIDVAARKDEALQLTLNPKPARSNVVVTAKELKLNDQVHFLHGSAEILPDSAALIQEIALTLKEHPEITQVEIQGHTDDSGTPDFNMRLSNERANAVREALIVNGVEAMRLVARGYGQDKPLVPNTSDRNRAKNRRVQLIILDKQTP